MNVSPEQAVVWALSFGAYYLGIVIRKVVLPGPNAPSLPKQLLLGIPVSLVVVSVLSVVLESAVQNTTTNASAILATLGLIVEHGMILNETVAKQLKERLGTPAASPAI